MLGYLILLLFIKSNFINLDQIFALISPDNIFLTLSLFKSKSSSKLLYFSSLPSSKALNELNKTISLSFNLALLYNNSTQFIKLDFIKSNNIKYPSNITYAEDLATTASLFLYNPVVDIEEDNLYYYFQRINSVSNIINNKVLEVSKAIRFIKEILVERNLYESYKNEFEY